MAAATARLPNPDFWRGRPILLTGHSGFKGGWAALWLARMGARVTGLALPPDTTPSLFALAGVDRDVESRFVDLRDREATERAVISAEPEIAIHMAAQPLVREGLRDPVSTFATNVMGTVHLLDALARVERLRAVLVVTSDKVYAGRDDAVAFTETDPLGGKDPYSASKAAQELVAASYAASRFAPEGVRLATARGGNVIGGGDFSEDRILPDIVRAARAGSPLVLRHPEAVRPWQHVIDCLAGYLVYCEALVEAEAVPTALNFGPLGQAPTTVAALAETVQSILGATSGWRHEPVPGSLEARFLMLDSSLARTVLGWGEALPGAAAIEAAARWYGAWLEGADMRQATLAELDSVLAARTSAG